MVLVVRLVESVLLLDCASDLAIDGPADVVGLPIDGVCVLVLHSVCSLESLAVVVCRIIVSMIFMTVLRRH